MQKHGLKTLLLLCTILPTTTKAESNNWCGLYFEENNQSFIRLPMSDVRTGSDTCNYENYITRARDHGTAKIALEFTKNRSALNHWRKFDGHLIEVRGKLHNGEIRTPRFVRDLGV